jgi:hypothetical protein
MDYVLDKDFIMGVAAGMIIAIGLKMLKNALLWLKQSSGRNQTLSNSIKTEILKRTENLFNLISLLRLSKSHSRQKQNAN